MTAVVLEKMHAMDPESFALEAESLWGTISPEPGKKISRGFLAIYSPQWFGPRS